MTIPTCSGYHFSRDVIQRAVWMYLRFTLSYRRGNRSCGARSAS